MKFIEYDLTDKNGKSNCVIRSLCKILNKNYNEVSNELVTIAKEIKTKYVENKGLCITEFTDFQIINGGQTTASLASADIKDKASLDNIFVK